MFRQIPRNATADHEVSAYGYLKRSVYAEFRVHDKFDRWMTQKVYCLTCNSFTPGDAALSELPLS